MANGDFLDQEKDDNVKKGVSEVEDLLQTEFDGRVSSLKREIRQLDDRKLVNLGMNRMKMGKMQTLQVVNNLLRYVYLIVLAVFLVLFARERWPEYYESRDWLSMLVFVATGTFLLLLPYYLLDAILYIHGRLSKDGS